MALYVKHIYNKDPHFKDTKVVYSFYNDKFDAPWDKRFSEKLLFEGFPQDIADKFKDSSFLNVSKIITDHCDGVTIAIESLHSDLKDIYDTSECHKMAFTNEENQAKELSLFFDKVIENVLV
jgi:starch synthase